ncbi:MAG TPA: ABC transporter ATP-binding protein [Longimicrobiales bacterium]|nr:ABC transporter ATP-binding protein [Longimicrobiales bacterium]
MVDTILSAECLVRRYGGRTVVDVAALELRPGEVLAVVGPNGAGKSTLFRLLLLLERADAGVIRFMGEAVRHGGRPRRGRMAGVFQRPVLFSGTVRSNVRFAASSLGLSRSERERRVETALGWLGLESLADAPVAQLSGGEAQRAALARAVVLEPDVLFLDEPTANLDVTMRRRFRLDLERVARRHARGIVVITHDPVEALGMADRIAVLSGGRIVQSGTPEDLVLRPGSPFIAELTGAELILRGVVGGIEDGVCSVAVGRGVTLLAAAIPADPPVKGGRAVVAYRPEDVVLEPQGGGHDTSAMNRIPVRVSAVVPAGGMTRVHIAATADPGTVLTALVTRRSAEALGLRAGMDAVAQLKATALHAWRGEA